MSASGGLARRVALRREECLHVSDLRARLFVLLRPQNTKLILFFPDFFRKVKRRLSTQVPSSAGSSKLARLVDRNERESKSPCSSVSVSTTRARASPSRVVRTSRSSSDCMATFASSGRSKTCTCTGTPVSLPCGLLHSSTEEQENSTHVHTSHRQRSDSAFECVSQTTSECLRRSHLSTDISLSAASTSRAIAT